MHPDITRSFIYLNSLGTSCFETFSDLEALPIMLAPASDSDVGHLRETVVLIVSVFAQVERAKMFDLVRGVAIAASTHSALVSISKSRLMAAARQNFWSFAYVWLITAAANHWNASIRVRIHLFRFVIAPIFLIHSDFSLSGPQSVRASILFRLRCRL